MRRWFRLISLYAAALAVCACGSEAPPTPPLSGPGFGPGNMVSDLGGSVQFDTLRLDFPAGALRTNVVVNVVRTFEVAVPEGLLQLGPAFELQPAGTELLKPVVVTLGLSASTLGASSVVLQHSTDGKSFSPVVDSSYVASALQLTGSIDHFGFVAATAESIVPVGSGGSGGGGN